MKAPVLTGIATWISLIAPSPGCGPFFADTVLDHPQSALDVPPVSYIHDLYQMSGIAPPSGEIDSGPFENPFLGQIPPEARELGEIWKQAGVDAGEIDRRLVHYKEVRQKLLEPIHEAGPMDFPTHDGQPLALPIRPLGAEFPADVADYVEAARLHATGNTAEARKLWKGILDRPPAERRLRAAWAAWMLAKTSADLPECLDWYARVETECQSGATDVIGLRGAAKAWRAGKMADGPVQAVHFYYDAFAGGKSSAAVDLRNVSGKILATGDAGLLAAAAADPLVRRLINLDLHASLDGPRQSSIEEPSPDEPLTPPAAWLAALEAHAALPLDDGARVAWALYSSGRYDESRKWLKLSTATDPLAIWLQAKFDLRDGNPDAAEKHLAEVIRIRSGESDWNPANPVWDGLWYSEYEERARSNQGRLLADAGIVALARKDYLHALESLRKGGYREDAAYLAESVISTDGLMKHVRSVAPEWTKSENEADEDSAPVDPYTCLQNYESHLPRGLGPDNQLRYLLARRLARENRLKEAREFMPPDLLPVLDHYIALDRARKSGRFSGEALAAITWRQARIQRHLGAELFSTDGAPDGGVHEWSFPVQGFSSIRAHQGGWSHEWSRDPEFGPPEKPGDDAIPRITDDEISRTRKYEVKEMKRFHYRYTAAGLAWEAAKSLPANHPQLAQLYNTAGKWLAISDPEAADRFYQAMVRRCAKTPEGQAADAKRWFLDDLEPLEDLPALPAEFTVAGSDAKRR